MYARTIMPAQTTIAIMRQVTKRVNMLDASISQWFLFSVIGVGTYEGPSMSQQTLPDSFADAFHRSLIYGLCGGHVQVDRCMNQKPRNTHSQGHGRVILCQRVCSRSRIRRSRSTRIYIGISKFCVRDICTYGGVSWLGMVDWSLVDYHMNISRQHQ